MTNKNRLNVNKRNHKGPIECKTEGKKSSRWEERFVFGNLPQRSKAWLEWDVMSQSFMGDEKDLFVPLLNALDNPATLR